MVVLSALSVSVTVIRDFIMGDVFCLKRFIYVTSEVNAFELMNPVTDTEEIQIKRKT